MFVGRTKELKKLNDLYCSEDFEFVVLYGRRRVGKTTLIQEFIKDKTAAYYMAVEGTKNENLAGLSKALLRITGEMAYSQFPDFEALLSHIDLLAKRRERYIVVIDEFPYLAASYPAISSMIQQHIDHCWKDSNLFLILCGSSMSFMEEQVLGYKSPLYGRRTAQFKIRPFHFFDAVTMLPGFSYEDQAVLYGVTGGIPEYLSRITLNKSVDDNIIQLFFQESGRLFEEPANLLKQELREPASYHSIVSAIAGGASRMNEIATKTGLETSGCSSQLNSLISLGIVRKEVPITEPSNSKKTIYRLEDSMFTFWYRFVRANASAIIQEKGEPIYRQLVKPQINNFMGLIFEEICKQYLFLPNIYEKLPFPIGDIGRWWGTNPAKKCQEEIDLMSVLNNIAILGECKWNQTQMDVPVIQTLLERGELFPHLEKTYFCFSKTGFSQNAIRYAKDIQKCHLVSLSDIIEAGEKY